MRTVRTLGVILAISTLSIIASTARGQNSGREDLSPCPGSAPEPTQSAAWEVSFCNRTGHDLVIEFHDNECPARDWDRRGDVYQRTLRRGESKTLPLCYANEPQQAKKLAPGVPMVRIPGGKGVVTTWSVVGDCGDRSKPLSRDARTFYDRGDYKTGIILLQYPAGASHCMADSTAAAGAPPQPPRETSAAAQPVPQSTAPAPGAAAPSSVKSQQAVTAPTQPVAQQHSSAPAPSPPPTPSPPSLTAVIGKDAIARSVSIYANRTGAPGYSCKFILGLTFSDGGSWNDNVNVNVTGSEGDAPVATRKYLKSVSKVTMTSPKCTPL